MINFILGGARSGKSHYAQQVATDWAKAQQTSVVVVVTATAFDDAMSDRIARHIKDRPNDWQTIEAPLTLAETLTTLSIEQPNAIILVDCLTLWLNNQLYQFPEIDVQALILSLVDACKLCKNLIVVSNEVGLGVIPLGEVSRQFVDEAGRMNQHIAQLADNVSFVVSGLVQQLKGSV